MHVVINDSNINICTKHDLYDYVVHSIKTQYDSNRFSTILTLFFTWPHWLGIKIIASVRGSQIGALNWLVPFYSYTYQNKARIRIIPSTGDFTWWNHNLNISSTYNTSVPLTSCYTYLRYTKPTANSGQLLTGTRGDKMFFWLVVFASNTLVELVRDLS